MRDPLLSELSTLTGIEPTREHAEAVRRAALDWLEGPAPRPGVWPTFLVVGAVLGYFCWSLLVVLRPYS